MTKVELTRRGTGNEPVRAVGQVTLDRQFLIHNVRVVDVKGKLIVAMPSKPLRDRCPSCSSGNPINVRHCGNCGGKLGDTKARLAGRHLFLDVCHPLAGSDLREKIDKAVLDAYEGLPK